MSEQGSNESDHEEADNGQQQIQDPSMPIDSGICCVADDVRTLGLKFATTTGIFNSSLVCLTIQSFRIVAVSL